MANNEILEFAGGVGANVIDQATYDADLQRLSGNIPGIARSALNNKALKQSSLLSAAVAQFIADFQAADVTDELTAVEVSVMLASAVSAKGGVPTAVAGGTVNALTADFTPDADIVNGTTVIIRAAGANTSTTPTLNVDGAGAKTIVKQGNNVLVPNDIKSAGHWLVITWDSLLDKWVLDNPATGTGATGGGTDKIFYLNGQVITQNYTVAIGDNAMTAGPVSIADGVVVTVADGSTWSIV